MSVKKGLSSMLTASNKSMYKVKEPEAYTKKRGKLQAFLTQVELYLKFHQNSLPTESDKVLYVANLLKGKTFNWFEPRLRDYLKHTEKEQDDDTQAVFASYREFTKRLREVFKKVNKKRTAERNLQQLRQNESAANYTSEFRRITAKIN
jgi:Retrotransposon gag protein